MGALRDSGRTKLNVSQSQRAEGRDELLEAVRQTAADEFEVFGEMARLRDGTIAYLARDLTTQSLAVLRLTRERGGPNEYGLDVARELDGTVPAPESACPRCQTPLRSWGRFCTQCGLDMWTGPPVGHEQSREEMLEAAKQAVAGKFEILGEMSRAGGGGIVYFARELATGRIDALRLQQEQGQQYSIGLTSVLQRAVEAPDQDQRKRRRPK